MRFGGHETFTVREGWLFKGLNLIGQNPEAFFDKVTLANALGVGVNMGKSIEHWMLATGLVSKIPLQTAREVGSKYAITPLGKIINEYDQFMVFEETWWILHINLVMNSAYAATWDWFFNEVGESKFDKKSLVSRLFEREKRLTTRPPSLSTLERDLTCFLNTYAQQIPREHKNPEEDYGSPFQDLGIMVHHKNSDIYELIRRPKTLLPEILLYSINMLTNNRLGTIDYTLSGLNRERSGPLSLLSLTSDAFFNLALSIEPDSTSYGYSVMNLAGDRQIVYNNPGNEILLSNLYARLT